MNPTESHWERKRWERVMLVRDGSSMLYFLNNGGRSETHEFDWGTDDRAAEEFDKAEVLVMTKGFKRVDPNPASPQASGINPDFY